MTQLPRQTAALYAALEGKGEVPIVDLFDAIFSDEPEVGPRGGNRHAQQWLGPYITRLNRRLKTAGLAVKPGRRKGTYALVKQ